MEDRWMDEHIKVDGKTILFSQIAKDGSVIAFEPDPANFKYLVKNKELNDLHNVTLVNKGVSSEIREFEFYQDITTGRTSSIETDAWHPNATILNKLTISAITLKEAYNVYGKPDLIKCDVEGHELEVLKGAGDVLVNKPIIILEVQEYNRKQVERILLDFDYRFLNAELPIEHVNNSAKIIEFLMFYVFKRIL
jgi:FkbM family methyltransferase